MRLSDCWYMSFTPNGGACQNPLEKQAKQGGGLCTRICAASLPLLLNAPVTLIAQGWISQSHCKAIFPIHQAMAVALESSHVYSEVKELSQNGSLMSGARLAGSAAIIALTLFHLPAGLMAMTARDLSVEVGNCGKELGQGNYGRVLLSVQKIALYTLYLACAYYTSALSLGILYASAQVVSNVYHAGKEVWKGSQGDWIALAGHAALALQQGQRAENLRVANKIISNMNTVYDRIRAIPAFANSRSLNLNPGALAQSNPLCKG